MDSKPYERYQEKPFLGSSHWWAINGCEAIKKDDRVLDIGPGSGILGKHLRKKGVETIAAVEIDSDTREKLRDIYTPIVESIDDLNGEKYDCVLLMDVLEHMTDPFTFVTELKPLLAPNALVLISVPNITHWAIRLMILCGYFQYMERGPLDRTHFQFFSVHRVRELNRHFGAKPLDDSHRVEIDGTIEPLELFIPEWLSNNVIYKTVSRFRIWLANTLPSLFAYQYVTAFRLKS